MSSPYHFPSDENGAILRQMYEAGDDLSQARLVDFFFIFSRREQALMFAREVDDKRLEICLSWYQSKSAWQVVVKCDLVPDHSSITDLETRLASGAKDAGGKADGWGCMQVPILPS